MKKIYLLFLGLLAFTFQAFASETVAIDTGATAWMLTSTALVLLMVPGLAMFYGGLVRSKNVLGTMMHSFVAMGVMSVLWVAVGYSMSFGKNVLGGWFGWNPDYFFLSGIDETITAGGIPEYVFSMFQGKFAIITPALIAGAFAERVSFKGYILFIAIWGIFIYNPLCHWVWAEDGFLFNLGPKGAIDFAGGTVVHISAGVSGLVAAIYLGTRRGYPHRQRRPNNLVMTLMGAGLLWVGWFGFNAGSSLSSGLVTAQALTATQAAAAAGAISWILIESLHVGKTTALGFVSGILAGLVAVTPAAGVVQPIGAMALGVIASIICYMAIILKDKLGYDDSLDAFGIHGVGGIVGALLLSFFIRASWMADAATLSEGGWSALQQFGIQATAVGIAIAYAVVGTLIIIWIVEKTVGFKSKTEEELQGLDHAYHGERGYGMLNPN
ncbi:MAG TPA: ammonia channel protein [Marinilabiliales bacterium]|nr:MAG: ammonia channel protein [Bacteroidetes bacterium GWC2_40_13]OFX72912.1 MAG: ammonia channel protein [Bacteroidetes bacterium GWD2_40_43]OFX91555.1 MAG: ammonia channel protein [Bacteroidetes bacterium GWE2_40_63]OFY19716.1 MAG: ammonia channel protein [Bacteroidetes bacterium GWF2_40_13]OFZ25442.1 MAG: ammonia channel protein [Bacteroidetes bacterium RIFOXYC2_FULL_40_12]HAN00428.1 ammonia channel protein [Marinilabiliales bacterium]